MEKVNALEKFKLIKNYYDPKIVGEINDSYVKLAKLKGGFPRHSHRDEDEMFYVIEGELKLVFDDKEITLRPGEFIIVPRGVWHSPDAEDEALVMFIEPKTTLNTGTEINERTVAVPERV